MKRGEDYHVLKIPGDRAAKIFADFGYGSRLRRDYTSWHGKFRRFDQALRKAIGSLIDRDVTSMDVLRIGFDGQDYPAFQVIYFGPIEDWALIRLRYL